MSAWMAKSHPLGGQMLPGKRMAFKRSSVYSCYKLRNINISELFASQTVLLIWDWFFLLTQLPISAESEHTPATTNKRNTPWNAGQLSGISKGVLVSANGYTVLSEWGVSMVIPRFALMRSISSLMILPKVLSSSSILLAAALDLSANAAKIACLLSSTDVIFSSTVSSHSNRYTSTLLADWMFRPVPQKPPPRLFFYCS